MSHYLSPSCYLPHDAPMLLLEEVVDVTDCTAICRVAISHDGVLAPFINIKGQLPAWYSLELMAQTVGVWSGWHRKQKGEERIALGMILGARDLVCTTEGFSLGSILDIEVNLLMQDTRFGSFECVIKTDNTQLASGRINTFQPTTEELATFFDQGDNA
ncbi:MAG: hypothetical protein ACRC9R_00375 [Enterovibrio sp.]